MVAKDTMMSGLCFLLVGCNLMTGSPTQPDVKPKPDAVEVKYTDADYFAFMAKLVEVDQVNSSDDLVVIAEKLKATGLIADVSRLSEIRKKRIEPIAGDDKTRIIATLKGL
jgi:hypothetical protein